jgi:hypothetical protein
MDTILLLLVLGVLGLVGLLFQLWGRKKQLNQHNLNTGERNG